MALQFELDLTIDPDSLSILRQSQLKITIAKPVNGASPDVTWLVFDPFEGNKVQWEEEYGIYASPNAAMENGATISRLSEVFPAQDAAYYNFTSNAVFEGPNTDTGAPDSGSFKVENMMPNTTYPVLTFGLEQSAAINGGTVSASPINAALVPSALSATFTPLTTVYIWVQADFTSGTVITEVNGDAAVVTFGGDVTTVGLVWDPSTGRFVPAGESGEAMSFKDSSNVKLARRKGVHSMPQLT